MLAEVLIFVPSVANFRVTWLNDRLTAAQLAALAAEAVPGGDVPVRAAHRAAAHRAGAAVASRSDGERRLVLPPEPDIQIDAHYDLRASSRNPALDGLSIKLGQIRDAIALCSRPATALIRVVGRNGDDPTT